MKRFNSSYKALLLIVIYAAIIMAQLVPINMRTAVIAHAVTGECVGDCAICGCSPEHSANRTCCCWKKKLQGGHGHEHAQTADCCKKKGHGSKPVLRCGCPCGDNKQLAFWAGETYEQLPYRFSENTPAFHADDLSTLYRTRLTDRYGVPPDPPPKLTILS
jgi:hypothetical protein